MATAKDQELEGQVAIITGAARNIGRAMALDLAAGGARVVINAMTSMDAAGGVKQEIIDGGGEAIVIQGDITKPDDVARIVDGAMEAFGRVDILVNNAAVRLRAGITELSFEDWRRVVSIILDGAFLCTKAVVPHMVKQGSGTIISMGGLTAHAGAEERVHVTTAKAGIVGFTKGMAAELAPKGITVNCVVPGLIDTTRGTPTSVAHHHQNLNPLVGRLGKTSEVSAMVRHLCGPESRYITGQTIHVNGGAYLP